MDVTGVVKITSVREIERLNQEIVRCERCPRLRSWCSTVASEKKRAFIDDDYWGRPVPNFGDDAATRLIVGLAPAAHGANRTGRMFTGDRSGDWLYRGLHRVGLASQPDSTSATDGLKLNGVLITATAHCAPPANKPTPDELVNCRPYLEALLAMQQFKVVLALGSIAWQAVQRIDGAKPAAKFAHGTEQKLKSGAMLLGSYHPSQQNTFTGKLTESMFDSVMKRFAELG